MTRDEESEVEAFYRNAVVFITGGSGTIGKLVIEKLLRSCQHIDRIYVLLRSKKGLSVEERKHKLFQNHVFDRVSQQLHKVSVVCGDCVQPLMGLDPSDYEMLTQRVNIVLHLAATVRFDESLDLSFAINVEGTKKLIAFSRNCKNLKAIVHVSTAFCNNIEGDVQEEFYDPPFSVDEISNVLSTFQKKDLEVITQQIIAAWPNTYTFTKMLAESYVNKTAADLPISVVRPSLVIPAYKEPFPGKLYSLLGIAGVAIGYGLGVIRVFCCDPRKSMDVVPIDYVSNCIVVAALPASKRVNENGVPVYHITAGEKYTFSFGKLLQNLHETMSETPSVQAIWYPFMLLVSSEVMCKTLALFLHVLPATVIDMTLWLSSRETKLVKIYRKVSTFTSAYSPFTHGSPNFCRSNAQRLYEELGERDKKNFCFDISNIVWKTFIKDIVMSARRSFLKEDDSTIPKGKLRHTMFYIAHVSLTTLLAVTALWFMWTYVPKKNFF